MPSSMLTSISISISDDESDESAGRVKARGRRKRKKQFVRLNKGFVDRALRMLARWWPLLVLVLAIILLLFETSKLGWKQNEEIKASQQHLESFQHKKTNLNSLNPTTRFVNGVREACLKMLKPEELNKLEFPENAGHSSPVKSLKYRSDSGHLSLEANTTLRQQNGTARFNLFTGYETPEEREESFNVKNNAEVHCGFYSDNGGFHISKEDKHYMQDCKAVVSTCAFGGGDDLYQPIGMTENSLNKVCYVAFWDEITRAAQEAEGNKISGDSKIGKWRIVIVRDLPFSDQRLNGKIPKMLSHRLFPQARYSIWVDSKSQLRRDPLGVLEALLWRINSVFAISEHGARSNLYEEAKAIVKKHKANPEEVDLQIKQYRYDGIPDDNRLHGKKALAEASIIVREHTHLTNLFMCLWFNEVVRFTSRDQLSFPYVLRRLWIPKMNMFPVCTRKDLVNSMGHKRKVKPLEE